MLTLILADSESLATAVAEFGKALQVAGKEVTKSICDNGMVYLYINISTGTESLVIIALAQKLFDTSLLDYHDDQQLLGADIKGSWQPEKIKQKAS